jgi:hypothetical protein
MSFPGPALSPSVALRVRLVDRSPLRRREARGQLSLNGCITPNISGLEAAAGNSQVTEKCNGSGGAL